MLGISRQTLQGRCAILCVKQYPKHFSSGFWIALHWIKTAKPLRETKVYVNADLSYLLFTALEVVSVLLFIAFLHLRSISIDKQVLPYTFPCVAFIIIQPCLCLLRFEILKR